MIALTMIIKVVKKISVEFFSQNPIRCFLVWLGTHPHDICYAPNNLRCITQCKCFFVNVNLVCMHLCLSKVFVWRIKEP